MTLKKIIKNLNILLLIICLNATASILSMGANIDSVMGLISSPIAGFSLPNNIISQAKAYLLSNPNIDYDSLEAELIKARGIVESSIKGKEIDSLQDIVNTISSDQKNEVVSNLQAIASKANLSIAVEEQESGEEGIIIMDKSTGAPAISQQSIIKATGRISTIKDKTVKFWMFICLFFVEIYFFTALDHLTAKERRRQSCNIDSGI